MLDLLQFGKTHHSSTLHPLHGCITNKNLYCLIQSNENILFYIYTVLHAYYIPLVPEVQYVDMHTLKGLEMHDVLFDNSRSHVK